MKLASLHEFMSAHREELLRLVLRDMQAFAPDPHPEELAQRIRDLIGEVIRALQHHAGHAVTSPLPGASQTAMWLGSRRLARGYAIARIAEDVGAISNSMGQLARRENVSFPGSEYQIFNQCIDTAIAAALDQYSKEADEQRERDATERVGMAVHELRNTLAAARMSFSVLRRGEVGMQSKTSDVLDRSLQRLETLIGQLVFAVQLGAGVQLTLRPLSLATLVTTVMDATAPERGITFGAEVDQSLSLAADENLLISAVGNLIQNAFKFTRDGGHIILRGYRQGTSVVIEVEDECGGLQPGSHEELFAPFVSKSTGGLGLGLTITRDAVEAHGGKVSVTNLPEKGCVFRLTLPLRDE